MSPELNQALEEALSQTNEDTLISILKYIDCYNDLPLEAVQETRRMLTVISALKGEENEQVSNVQILKQFNNALPVYLSTKRKSHQC